MTHKPPQGIDAPCFHINLVKQVGPIDNGPQASTRYRCQNPECGAFVVTKPYEVEVSIGPHGLREQSAAPRPELAPAISKRVSDTQDCSFCDDIIDANEHPELNVGRWHPCLQCWHKMQDYLTTRGFTLLQAEREGPPDLAGLAKIIEKLREDAHTMESPYWTHDPAEPDWAYVAKAFREIADELAAQLKVQR